MRRIEYIPTPPSALDSRALASLISTKTVSHAHAADASFCLQQTCKCTGIRGEEKEERERGRNQSLKRRERKARGVAVVGA